MIEESDRYIYIYSLSDKSSEIKNAQSSDGEITYTRRRSRNETRSRKDSLIRKINSNITPVWE